MDSARKLTFRPRATTTARYEEQPEASVQASGVQATGAQVASLRDSAAAKPAVTSQTGAGLEQAAAQAPTSASAKAITDVVGSAAGARQVTRLAPVGGIAAQVPARRADTVTNRLEQRARELAQTPAYYTKVDKAFVPTTYAEYFAKTQEVSRALMALGVQHGEVATLYANNTPEWCLFDLGLMNIGAASAGAYPDLGAADLAHIVKDSGSRILMVETERMWRAVKAEAIATGQIEHVILLKGPKPANEPNVMMWDEFVALGSQTKAEDLEARRGNVRANELATLIYTSGTTGKPKGVMLSHKSLAWAGDAMRDVAGLKPGDKALCYLRLGHVADRMFSLVGPISTGSTIYFSSAKDLAEDLRTVAPTAFFGVPRVWDLVASKIESGAAKKLEKLSGVKRWFADKMLGVFRWVGKRATQARNEGRTPSGWLYDFAAKRFFDPVKQAVGVQNARVCVTGAAPMSPATARVFGTLDLPILDAYGLSETTGLAITNRPGANRVGALGKPANGVDIKLGADGEILVRGPNVFMGYWKNAEATADVLKDGWLHTGDLGRIDETGNIFYVGRKKRSFKLVNGEFVNPEPIESKLTGGIVGEAVVVGREQKQLGAAIILDPVSAADYAKRLGVDKKALAQHPEVQKAVQERLDAANRELEGFLKVRKFFIVDRDLSNAPDGEIGPTGKLKVNVFEKTFAPQISAMFGGAAS